MFKPLVACLGFAFLTFSTSLAAAQDVAAAPESAPVPPVVAPSPSPAAPDLIRLTNGGMVRGTIAEFVPGEYVVVVTVTGETRRLAAAEFTYAGPAAQDPQAAQAPVAAPPPAPAPVVSSATTEEVTKPLITVKAGVAGFHFDAAPMPPKANGDAAVGQPLTLYLRTGTATAVGSGGSAVADAFSRVCTAPCDAELAEGSYTFGLGEGDNSARKVDGVISVAAGDTLVGRYQSRRGLRIGGWVVMGAGFGIGLPVMLSTSTDSGNGGLIGGAVVMCVGALVGLIMTSRPDVATITKR